MSNVKWVNITGTIPYNCSEHPRMAKYLASLNAPSIGISIRYGKSKTVRNDTLANWTPAKSPADGKTTMYEFEVNGQEAVSDGYIIGLMQAVLDCGGTVASCRCQDIENEEWLRIPIPTTPNVGRIGVYFEFTPENPAGPDNLPEHYRYRDFVRKAVEKGLAEQQLGLLTPPKGTLDFKVVPDSFRIDPA